MRKRVMSGILAVVCAAMILGTGVSMAPMQEVYAAQGNGNNQSQNEDDDGNTTTTNPEQDLEKAKNSAMGTLQDYQHIRFQADSSRLQAGGYGQAV